MMRDSVLNFAPEIVFFEKGNMWNSAVKCAYQKWEIQSENENLLCCAGAEIWYALLEMDYWRFAPNKIQDMEFVDIDEVHELLWKVASYGEKNFAENVMFNAYFGYMYTVTPYRFNGYNGDYIGWQKKGERMIRKAFEKEPGNLLVRALASIGNDSAFSDACCELWANVTPEQWGTGAVQEYFFFILGGQKFYPSAYECKKRPQIT